MEGSTPIEKRQKLEKLLFATSFGEMAFKALETLFVLKAAGLREILFCHIIPRETVGFVPFGGYLKEEAGRLREEAGIKFGDWGQAVSAAGIGSRTVIEVGEPAPDVASIAVREGADLLVLGRGPLALDIARRSRVPVLVHGYLARFELEGMQAVRENRFIFENPLLAVDWSPASERALRLLVSLAGAVKRAGLVHIVEGEAGHGRELSRTTRPEETRRRQLARLEPFREALLKAGITAEAHVGAGRPAIEIIETARSVGAGMIMAGAAGGEGPELGSVARRLCELSEFPVLLVPAPVEETS